MNDLRKEFGDTYTIIMEDGFFEFLEGKATPEQTERIEKIMEDDIEARQIVNDSLEYDNEHGKGALYNLCKASKESFMKSETWKRVTNHPDPS